MNTAHHNTQHTLSLQSTTLAQRPMCFGRKFIKGITAFVILSVANMTLLPLAQAVQTQRAQQRSATLVADSAATRYASLLGQLKGSVLTQDETAHASRLGNKRSSSSFSAAAFENLARQMQQESDELKKTWRAAGVDESVLQAQEQIDQAFAAQHRQLLHALQSQNDGELAAFARASIPEPPHHRIDLDNMPWQVLKNQARQPLHTTEELNRALGLAQENAPRAEQGSAAQKNQPAAAATTQQPATQRALPAAAEYAPTLDAPHTADIKALAQSLNNDPHKIYQWVHDNIHYFPSHASVQGAQDTLDKKSGNAFDTASLLIALLRASGVPARYVYGTVDIPADKAMNWVGGAQTIDAAQQILGQGSVPNTALISAGQAQTLRIEHVWVEAWIPYSPSRGAKTTAQSGHGWIPMDGSFKQYTFHEGMDLQTTVPLDAQALLDAAQQGAEINEEEGWVRNLNTAAVENQLKAYQNQLEAHINSQNNGNSTVGDVLGARKPQIDKLPWLAGSLPYKVQATAQRFSEIPNNLRAQFRYRIYRDAYSRLLDDAPLLHFQQPTVALAGKKLTLAWVAASPASQQALEALIPTPAPGEELKPEQLPRFIPNSIYLKPEIRVDGITVASGSAQGAGTEVIGAGAFTWSAYGGGGNNWDETTDALITGQQTALGLSIQGMSQKQLETLKTRMEATKATLEAAQAAPESQREAILQNLTAEDITGDMLTATIWGYFASLHGQGRILAQEAQFIDLPALSYGLLHSQVKPVKIYGIVTTGVNFKGINMDVGHLRSIRWVQDDNPQSAINNKPELTQNGKSAAQNRWIAYNKTRGNFNSAMEHATIEDFWVNKSQCRYQNAEGQVINSHLRECGQAISAVKALAIAQQQGQKIYTINAVNAATALAQLPVAGGVGSEIRSAVQAGKEVMVHASRITQSGWSGYGYIIVEPETGAGAYLIESAGNGGELVDEDSTLGTVWAWITNVVPAVLKKVAGGVVATLFAIIDAFIKLKDCDSTLAAVVVGGYSVITTALFSWLTVAIATVFLPVLAVIIVSIVIAVILSYALSYLMTATADSVVCKPE